MYSVRRITEGAWIASFCEWSMWPLCSSTRATPLKIITTARLSVHTLIGSKEVFRTKTLPFMLRLILRERGRECQKYVARGGTLSTKILGQIGHGVEQSGARTSQERWAGSA